MFTHSERIGNTPRLGLAPFLPLFLPPSLTRHSRRTDCKHDVCVRVCDTCVCVACASRASVCGVLAQCKLNCVSKCMCVYLGVIEYMCVSMWCACTVYIKSFM
jgi:hypothetical protein